MAFGLNRVQLIGRIGADVTVNHLASGGRVAGGQADQGDLLQPNGAGAANSGNRGAAPRFAVADRR